MCGSPRRGTPLSRFQSISPPAASDAVVAVTVRHTPGSPKEREATVPELSPGEVDYAGLWWVASAQKECYSATVTALSTGKSLQPSDPLEMDPEDE